MKFFAFLLVPLFVFDAAWAKQKKVPEPSATPPPPSVILDRIEATVGASIILNSDVNKFKKLIELRTQLDPLFSGTSLSTKGTSASDVEIVQFLIHERLICEKFPVTDPEVDQEIKKIQAENKIARDALVVALRQQGFQFEDYYELIKISMSKRNLIDRDIRTKVHVSDDDIKNYYFNERERRSAESSLAYRIKTIMVHPSNYTDGEAAFEVIQRALEQVRGGEAFEEVAKRVSDDPSGKHGGDLGVLSENEMSHLIREKVKTLKVGEISEILGDEKSVFFIVKLADIVSTQADSFAKAKEQIRNQLTAKEYQHQIDLWLDRQMSETFVHRVGDTIVPAKAAPPPPTPSG